MIPPFGESPDTSALILTHSITAENFVPNRKTFYLKYEESIFNLILPFVLYRIYFAHP